MKAGTPTAGSSGTRAGDAKLLVVSVCGADSAHLSLCRVARPHGPLALSVLQAKLQKAADLVVQVLSPTNASYEPFKVEPGGSTRLTVLQPVKSKAGSAGTRSKVGSMPSCRQDTLGTTRAAALARCRHGTSLGCSVLLGACRTCFGSKRHPADLHACCVCCCRQPSRRTSPAAAPGHPWMAAPRACHLHLR